MKWIQRKISATKRSTSLSNTTSLHHTTAPVQLIHTVEPDEEEQEYLKSFEQLKESLQDALRRPGTQEDHDYAIAEFRTKVLALEHTIRLAGVDPVPASTIAPHSLTRNGGEARVNHLDEGRFVRESQPKSNAHTNTHQTPTKSSGITE
jgi:hypothetical protein